MSETCNHCWHQWGPASGGIGGDGSSHQSGTNRCCYCGEFQKYEYRTGAQPPKKHGVFITAIQGHPA